MVVQDLPRPRPGTGELEIAVTTAAICSLDLAAFHGRSHSHTPPLVMGHECVGRVRDGRRVVVNPFICCGCCAACKSGAHNLCRDWRLLGMGRTPGCHAEYVVIPASHIMQIPDDLSDARAVLAEPLANVVHLLRTMEPVQGCRVGIVGMGTMGALALQLALRKGAREVLAEDLSEVRVSAASCMGATLAVNVAAEKGRAEAMRFAGDGLDVVVDACGTGAAREAAFALCRPGGLVVLLGMAAARSEVDFAASIRKEHRVAMSFGFTPADFAASLKLLEAGEVDLAPWTATMPLDEGQLAFEHMAVADATLKMLLRVC
jgi:2-desacetyl-2-hydroxyethyl bacteriochlorophyllide A dehydrogenase